MKEATRKRSHTTKKKLLLRQKYERREEVKRNEPYLVRDVFKIEIDEEV